MDPDLFSVSASNIWEVVVCVWLLMTALLMESAIKVQLNEIRVLSNLRCLGHGHVKWILVAKEVEVPGVFGLVHDHSIELVDLCVDELANLGQEALDRARDSALEPASNRLKHGVGQRDVDILEVHGSDLIQLPVHIIVCS